MRICNNPNATQHSPLVFALLGPEFFHYRLRPKEQNYGFFSRGLRGLFFDVLHLPLATVIYQCPADPLCGGILSAGFPVAFLCDNAAESPIQAWGIISWGVDNPNLLGAFVDILFYCALLWIISFMALRIVQDEKQLI